MRTLVMVARLLRVAWWLWTVLEFTFTRSARAQSRTPTLAEAEARIHQLDSLIVDRSAARQAQLTRDVEAGTSVIMRVGGFHLVVEDAIASRLRPIANDAWRAVAAVDSGWFLRNLPSVEIRLRRVTRTVPFGRTEDRVGMELESPRDSLVAGSTSPLLNDSRAVRDALTNVAWRLALLRSGRDVGAWVFGATPDLAARLLGFMPMRVEPMPTGWQHETYRDLVVHTSRSNRSCLAGDAEDCISSLGLGPEAQELATWYAPSDLVWLVIDRSAPRGVVAERRLYDDCVRRRADYACLSLVRSWTQNGTMAELPASSEVRQRFLQFAIAKGGAGSLDRFIADTGALGQRIAAAAGLPIEEVAGLWIADVRDNWSVAASASDRVFAGGRLPLMTVATIIASLLALAMAARRALP